jgi:hypothetical protein
LTVIERQNVLQPTSGAQTEAVVYAARGWRVGPPRSGHQFSTNQ